jgi:hypothetical protein
MVVTMSDEISTEFDKEKGALNITIGNYDDIIKDGTLTDEFFIALFEGYEEVEDSEKKKREGKLSILIRFRELINMKAKYYELPVNGIHIYPETKIDYESEYIRNVIIKSIGSEAVNSRTMGDRWELVEDISIGLGLLIDASAIINGLYRYFRTGIWQEGFAGVGYLAVLGVVLTILYFIFRIKGEEPCKKRNRYLTDILRTPITLHRKYGPQTEITFSPDSERISPDANQPP